MKSFSSNLECPGPLRIPPGVQVGGLKMAELGLKLLQKLFHKLLQIFKQKCCFTTVLATSEVIFWPFRTPEFIVKNEELSPGGPFRLVKYDVSPKFFKIASKNAFGSDSASKRDLAKTFVK